jgi:cobalt transporter subunit CbtB
MLARLAGVNDTAHDAPLPVPVVPLRELAPFVLLGIALLLLAGFAVMAPDHLIHEALHDGRHLLAFPCH